MLRPWFLAVLICCCSALCARGEKVLVDGSTKCETGQCEATKRKEATVSTLTIANSADIAQCLSGNCLAGYCNSATCPAYSSATRPTAADETATLAISSPAAQCPAAQCPAGQCPAGQCQAGQCKSATCLLGTSAKTATVANCQSGRAQACQGECNAVENGRVCEIKATLNGPPNAIIEKADAVAPPGNCQQGVPVVSKLPFIHRLFKNVGVPRAKVVLHIPREQVETNSQVTAPACCRQHTCSESETKVADSSCTQPTKASATYEVRILPSPQGIRFVGPALTPPPVPVTGPVVAQMQPPIRPSVYPPAYPTEYVPAPCSMAGPPPTAVPCPMAVHPDLHVPRQMVQLAAENARLTAQLEAQQEISKLKQSFHAALFEARMENAELQARQQVAQDREELINSLIETAIENARLEARVQYAAEREEMTNRFVETAVEKARLEARVQFADERQALRDELLDSVIDTAIDNARLEAGIEFAQEREALVTEMIGGPSVADSVNERVESIAVQLEREQAEKSRLLSKIAELERLIQEVSARSATHPIIK